MKNDLATAIVIAIVGIVSAYFICNALVPSIETARVKTVDASINADIASPDPEVFNYKSLNPTVEVYIGKCTNVDQNGKCIDDSSEQVNENIINGQDSNSNQNGIDERGSSNGTSN